MDNDNNMITQLNSSLFKTGSQLQGMGNKQTNKTMKINEIKTMKQTLQNKIVQ